MDTEVAVVRGAVETEVDAERNGGPGGILLAAVEADLLAQVAVSTINALGGVSMSLAASLALLAGFDLSFSKILSDCCFEARPLILANSRRLLAGGGRGRGCAVRSVDVSGGRAKQTASDVSRCRLPNRPFQEKGATISLPRKPSMWHQASPLSPIRASPNCPTANFASKTPHPRNCRPGIFSGLTEARVEAPLQASRR